MPIPSFTDLFALLGINLVLCAVMASLPGFARFGAWQKWLLLLLFATLWIPVGPAGLPIVAYVRGVSSDFSITLVVLAALGLVRRLSGKNIFSVRDTRPVWLLVAAAAIFLYPLALGLGDWDPYRLGWGSWSMWLFLLLASAIFWVRGLRLLPLLISLALLAWTAGLLESTNLWDYLLDPWVAILALAHGVQIIVSNLGLRLRALRSAREPGTM